MHEMKEETMVKSNQLHIRINRKIIGCFTKVKNQFKLRVIDKCKKKTATEKKLEIIENETSNMSEENKQKILKNLQIMGFGSQGSLKNKVQKLIARQLITGPFLEGLSLGFFSETNMIRKFFFKMVTHSKFDLVIIFFIAVSSIVLALGSPTLDPNSKMVSTLFWIDASTSIIFLIEATIKIITFGFIFNGNQSYLKQRWNILDFTIIVFSVMALSPLSDNFKTFKIFRTMRILRLVTQNDKLKLALMALFRALPNIMNITIIMILFYLIFGVVAVSYFKGKLYYCNNAE